MTTTKKDLTDLEIRIFAQNQRDDTSAGDKVAAGYPVEITLEHEQVFPRGYLGSGVVPWVSSGVPADDGQKLFDTLFADSNLRAAWAEARGQAPQRRVRLRIDPSAAELHALPWELLQQDAVMLSAQADTPFSRYLPIALPWSGAVQERPIRMLVVISDPADLQAKYDLAPVDVALERETLETALADVAPDELEIDFLDAPATPERLEDALREGYHVLHFIGHGAFSSRRGQAALYMQDQDGNARRVLDGELVSMLARQGVRPRLVFLVACQSATRSTSDAFLGLAPKLVGVGVPAVVAMQDVVTVETARKFSAAFYRPLLEHGYVDLAVNQARSTLLTAGRADAAVPVLFMRLKSGQLWGDEADARGLVLGSKNPHIFWSGLLRMLKQGRCTPIIGPRVRELWSPDPEEIARAWAAEHEYPFSDKHNLTRVAQYMASSAGADFPRIELLDALKQSFIQRLPTELRNAGSYDTLSDLVQAVGWQGLVANNPNEVHRVLASLDLPLYLTVNYDNFMTEALVARGKQPTREICPWSDLLDGLPSVFEDDPNYEPTPKAPLVYHLFGNDQEVDSLALTEDDYLSFLVQISAEMERIPSYVWAALTNNALMFLGFNLRDWGFRVILRGLVATRQRRRRIRHVGVQLEPGDIEPGAVAAAQSFLQQYFQDAEINVYAGTLQQFMAELREQWEAANE
jgi:hypothetical protein